MFFSVDVCSLDDNGLRLSTKHRLSPPIKNLDDMVLPSTGSGVQHIQSIKCPTSKIVIPSKKTGKRDIAVINCHRRRRRLRCNISIHSYYFNCLGLSHWLSPHFSYEKPGEIPVRNITSISLQKLGF